MSEFVPFRFRVNLYNPGNNQLLCSGAFSEVTGFELTMEPRTLAEGGLNWGEHQRIGVTRFAPMVLKRGVTSVNDLWSWFDATTNGANYGYRLHGEIEVLANPVITAPDDRTGKAKKQARTPEERVLMTWRLTGVLPTKFKGPDLNSTANQVAIEEVHLVHEGIEMERIAPTQSDQSTAGETAS